MMLTNALVKQWGREIGFDLVGIANIERFKDAPVDMHPSTVFPETRSVIVCAKAMPRGSLRGVEEGTNWISYDLFGQSMLQKGNYIRAYLLSKAIEREGWEAVPLTMFSTPLDKEMTGRTRPNPVGGTDNNVHHRLAAAAAGLGEIGWSKVFLTPQFGPRQRFAVILTDLALEPDPLFQGNICVSCMRCVMECPGDAMGGKKVSVKIEGREFEWGDVDLGKCKLCHGGVDRKSSPFLQKDIPGLRLDVRKQQMTWDEARHVGWALFPKVRYTWLQANFHGDPTPPVCGARGCVRACMDELEKEGIIPGFHTPFIVRKRWELPLEEERQERPWYVR